MTVDLRSMLNADKIHLQLTVVLFIGYLLTANGLLADPAKVEAILKMPTPTDLKALWRFLGLVNY